MTIDAHSGDNVIADINPATGVAVRSYVTPMLDQNVSFTDVGTSTTFYYSSGQRRTISNLTDSSGDLVQSYDFTAYGDKLDRLTSGSVEQRYSYTGRESDAISGEYYFRYRMYRAYSASFLSRDLLGMIDGPSVYAGYFASYVGLDPSGLKKKVCQTVILAGHSWEIDDWLDGESVEGWPAGPDDDDWSPSCGTRIGAVSCFPRRKNGRIEKEFPGHGIPGRRHNRKIWCFGDPDTRKRRFPEAYQEIEKMIKDAEKEVKNQCKEKCCDSVKLRVGCSPTMARCMKRSSKRFKHRNPCGKWKVIECPKKKVKK